MKKFKNLKFIALLLFVLVFKAGYSQDASGYAKKILSAFPTISQINNSRVPGKSKQLLLDTRTTLTAIAENNSGSSNQALKELISKLRSQTNEIQENIVVVMESQNDTGTPPERKLPCQQKGYSCFDNCDANTTSTPAEKDACSMKCFAEYHACISQIITSSLRTDFKTRGPGTATQK